MIAYAALPSLLRLLLLSALLNLANQWIDKSNILKNTRLTKRL